ncbi:putative ankyrin repeat-containing domain, PGG domain, ankyrin repeat-containing domain superfamily [Helianthus anomalus]
MLKEDKGLAEKEITSDGRTVLHIAVGHHRNYIVDKLLSNVRKEDKKRILEKENSEGCTALHIAASVGNTYAAVVLSTNKDLVQMVDHKGDRPLHKAYQNMHLDTIAFLLPFEKGSQPNDHSFRPPDDKFAVDLLVKAVSVKRYTEEFMKIFPQAALRSDDVLMALAQNFPRGLEDREELFYPSLKSTLEMLRKTAWVTLQLFAFPATFVNSIWPISTNVHFNNILSMLHVVLVLVKLEIKVIEEKEAKSFLKLVCDKIDTVSYPGTQHPIYGRPIVEAACQNAYDFVEEILSRLPVAIKSHHESEYDIIQLAIMNRSEKVYNLIHAIDDEHIHRHRNFTDSSKNNILHLAGRLAPSWVLNQRTGAALQLQHELQWYEEVKKIVFPTCITQKNNFKETPDMVFTREHANLLKEGEKWMTTTSESCSITASLIITIVFAAAITVPGGTDQQKGTPLFQKEPAFIIFAISDAISLFAASTSLLVFLSILTARFAEKDFLFSLPWRLFIGLSSLLLSTTTMMVAFSATLFLVFCDKKLWMLAPICGLALIPIVVFVWLQFPLMVDLFSSTYIPLFGKEKKVTFKNVISRTYKIMKLFTHDYPII